MNRPRFIILFSCLVTALARSEIKPIRKISLLDRPVPEISLRVRSARVVAMDRDLIVLDFPFLKGKSDEEIQAFLLEHAGRISEAQARQTLVNTEVDFDPESARIGYRPDYYGRAMVFMAGGHGLFDVKGAGSDSPSPHTETKHHEHGLCTLGEAIREFMMEKMVGRVLRHAGVPTRTVGSYAVIDWGFDAKDRGTQARAGAVVRQGHLRHPAASTYMRNVKSKNHFLNFDESLKIERLLRRYGLTATHVSDENGRTLIDVQGTPDNHLFDFGSYHFKASFSADAYWYPFRKKEDVFPSLRADSSEQPDPAIMLPASWWGSTQSRREDSKFDNPFIWAHDVARSLADGNMSPEMAEHWISEMLDHWRPQAGKKPAELEGKRRPRLLRLWPNPAATDCPLSLYRLLLSNN